MSNAAVPILICTTQSAIHTPYSQFLQSLNGGVCAVACGLCALGRYHFEAACQIKENPPWRIPRTTWPYRYIAHIAVSHNRLTKVTGIPYIGRVHDIPFTHNWLKFKQWGDKYGPIYQSTIFGEKHVWVMRESVAHDLLSKKGGIYADRPGIPAVPGSKSTGEYLPLLGFGGKPAPRSVHGIHGGTTY